MTTQEEILASERRTFQHIQPLATKPVTSDMLQLRQSLDTALMEKRMKKYKKKMTDLQFLRSDKATPDIFSVRNHRNQGVSIVSKSQPRPRVVKSVRLR